MTSAPRGNEVIGGDGATRAGAPGRKAGLAATGGVLGALASASCCVVPFVLFTLGAGGAWLGNLTALAPYQPYFFAFTFVFLAAGFVMVYRRPRAAGGAEGAPCPRPASSRLVKGMLWGASGLVALALAWPYVAPVLLDL